MRPRPPVAPAPIRWDERMGCDTHRPVHELREGTTATLCGDTRLQTCISRCALRCAAAAPILHIVFDAAHLPRTVWRECATIGRERILRFSMGLSHAPNLCLRGPLLQLRIGVTADSAQCRNTTDQHRHNTYC